MKSIILLTCEHATNAIPSRFQKYFDQCLDILSSHQGIDIGALQIARNLQKTLASDFYYPKVSRLLIDCNRSLNHRHCFSEISMKLNKAEKTEVIENFYKPYRQEVEQTIARHLNKNLVVWHFSIHSFTPIFNDDTRQTDIGLLYDPKRNIEKKLVHLIQSTMKPQCRYRIRKNYPYLGTSDGFTTALRKKFPDHYAGIEIEINQKWLISNNEATFQITNLLNNTFQSL